MADFISSPHLLILDAPSCVYLPLKWCKDGFQCVDGRSGFTPSKDPVCLPYDGKESQEANAMSTPSSISASGLPKAPAFTHLSLPVLCQFQQWGMPWGWNRHKIQMNQCPINQVLCLQARQSNYYPTRVPLLVLKDKQEKWIHHSPAISDAF